MRWLILSIPVILALTVAGCGASDDRQWMKLDQKYTTAEFQRDHAECTKDGKLDDACMRGRGWVAVNPMGKGEAPNRDPNTSPIEPPKRTRGY